MLNIKEYLPYILSTILSFAGISYLLFRSLKKAAYDKKEHRAILESIRESMERQIYSLNDRLIQTEERWRDVNHLLLRNEYVHNPSPLNLDNRVVYTEFLQANGLTEQDLVTDPRLVFVLTPFNDQFRKDYQVIREACSDLGYRCIRGDEQFVKGDIFPEMLKLIVSATLIIANINGRNPNVMYELGIAQALNKPVILLAESNTDLPFNIKSQRFLIYQDLNELRRQFKDHLKTIFSKH